MLHVMDRDMDSSEDIEIVGHNWRKIKNEAFGSMYILGRAFVKKIPKEYTRLIKGGTDWAQIRMGGGVRMWL